MKWQTFAEYFWALYVKLDENDRMKCMKQRKPKIWGPNKKGSDRTLQHSKSPKLKKVAIKP